MVVVVMAVLMLALVAGCGGGGRDGRQVWNVPRRDLQRPRDGGQSELRLRGVRGDRVMRRGMA